MIFLVGVLGSMDTVVVCCKLVSTKDGEEVWRRDRGVNDRSMSAFALLRAFAWTDLT